MERVHFPSHQSMYLALDAQDEIGDVEMSSHGPTTCLLIRGGSLELIANSGIALGGWIGLPHGPAMTDLSGISSYPGTTLSPYRYHNNSNKIEVAIGAHYSNMLNPETLVLGMELFSYSRLSPTGWHSHDLYLYERG